MDWIALFASIGAAIGALWIAWGEKKASKSTKVVATLVAFASVISLVQGYYSSKEQAAFEKEMRQSTERTLKTITGGESIALVSLRGIENRGAKAWLIIENMGDFPLYDVSLSIMDVGKADMEFKQKSQKSFLPYMQSVGPFNVSPGVAWIMPNWTSVNGDHIQYTISGTARNGSWSQGLSYRLVDKRWIMASQVSREGKVLFEKIDSNYPKDARGKPIW